MCRFRYPEPLHIRILGVSGHGCRLVLPPQLCGELAGGGGEARDVAAGAVDCMRPHLPDMIDLLHDPHLLNKIKVGLVPHMYPLSSRNIHILLFRKFFLAKIFFSYHKYKCFNYNLVSRAPYQSQS